jgi:hypothetical protein
MTKRCIVCGADAHVTEKDTPYCSVCYLETHKEEIAAFKVRKEMREVNVKYR